MFYLNGYLEGIYYPKQVAQTPNFRHGNANHPLDITMELEPRFVFELPGPEMELRCGIPLRYTVSPWYDYDGLGLPDGYGDVYKEAVHHFSVGVFFTTAFVGMQYPFDITVKYMAAVAGRNDRPIHQVSLTGRVNFKMPGSR
jgi:hypothetical protein